jgi:hypothetical protein
MSYQTFDGGISEVSEHRRFRSRSTPYIAAVSLALLSVCAIGVTVNSWIQQSPTELDAETYKEWLKTLSGGPEWSKTISPNENDPDWESQNMKHRDLSDLTPGALPSSPTISAMQGVDFANDVVCIL